MNRQRRKYGEHMINIRPEQNADIVRIYEINVLAFDGEGEAKLVNELRKSPYFIPPLSLVAESKNGIVVGHILFSKITIETEGGDVPTLALAPVAVIPNEQNKGIGSALVNEGIRKAKQLNYESVVVLGHADYYPKFGFSRASEKGIKPPFPVPDEAFMILELNKGSLKNVEGIVKYSEPFLKV
jgi:putative acetyltransferase